MNQTNSPSTNSQTDNQINERVSLLLNSLPMVLYSAMPHPNFSRTWIGENIGNVSGFHQKQFDDNPLLWTERIHPEDSERTLKEFGSLFFSENLSIEYRWLCADGTYHWFLDQAIPVKDEQGQPKEIIGNWLDITKQKHAEEQLREQAALLQIVQDAMLVLDLEDTVTFWNRSAEQLYGWSAQETLGKSFSELFFKSEPPELMEAHKVLIGKGEWSGELLFLTKSGKSVLCDSRWKLVYDAESKPVSIFVMNRDVTEQRKLEAQILRAQRMESISTLASGIAHDLNNVFSPILMGVSILKGKGLDEAAMNIINLIESNVNRGAEMVRQVHTFARGIEGEMIVLQPRHFIHDTETFVAQTFPKSIHLHVNVEKNLWNIYGELTQLRRVLLELCLNARDAMPKGGSLTITSKNVELTEPYTNRNLEIQPGKYVTISVADTGKGIRTDHLDKIFEPYFTTKKETEHRGLGLASVLGIIKSINGFVDVHTTPDRGTEFTIYFPAVEAATEQMPEAAQEEAPNGNGELVLVVDDEIDVITTTKDLLETCGYNVVTAMDGTEATAMYLERKTEIAIVLTDAMMPFMDGASMTRALQKINPAVKVIFMSGLPAHKIDMETAGKAVKGYLQKPFTTEAMLNTIHKAIHGV
ncbi:MAG: PAS domain-containing protein [Ignavibacteriae bacterium]|nr:PAS domain-containing protein [Ignavibacteriota bacterium]